MPPLILLYLLVPLLPTPSFCSIEEPNSEDDWEVVSDDDDAVHVGQSHLCGFDEAEARLALEEMADQVGNGLPGLSPFVRRVCDEHGITETLLTAFSTLVNFGRRRMHACSTGFLHFVQNLVDLGDALKTANDHKIRVALLKLRNSRESVCRDVVPSITRAVELVEAKLDEKKNCIIC